MPYITQIARALIDAGCDPHFPGDLNYKISKILLAYLGGSPNYAAFNEVMGVLACVSQEIYRRMIAPYENKKANENGDIFT